MRLLTLFLFCSASILSHAQQRITVVDQDNDRSLPFARIIPKQGEAYLTDIDGRFILPVENYEDSVSIGYAGYRTETIHGRLLLDLDTVRLSRMGGDLEAVEVQAGENPARKLILEVIRAKKDHDPAGDVSWESIYYNMVRFDVPVPDMIEEGDTATMELKKFLSKNYLFLMETVSQRYYKPGGLIKERILDQQISGLEEPTFAVIASQMQSFSFYDPQFSLAGMSLSNPLSKGSMGMYAYQIEDTLLVDGDTLIAVAFQPKPNVQERAMQGVMYIHSGDRALQRVVAKPKGISFLEGSSFSQRYARHGDSWFPEEIRADLSFGNVSANGQGAIGLALSTMDSLTFNPDKEVFKGLGYSVEVSNKKPDSSESIQALRADTTDTRMDNTYATLDSLAKEANMEKMVFFLSRLVEGYIPFWMLELDMTSILGGNEFEGYRLGLGLQTNPKLSKHFTVGGYGAYGLKDKKPKYGGYVKVFPNGGPEYQLELGYSHDVKARSSQTPYFSLGGLDLNGFVSSFYQDTMDYVTSAYLRSKIMLKSNLALNLHGSYNLMRPGNDIAYSDQDGTYNLNGGYWHSGVGVRWGIKEKVTKLFGMVVSTPSAWPVLYAHFDMGIPYQAQDLPFQFTHASVGMMEKLSLGKAGVLTSWMRLDRTWGTPGIPFLSYGSGTRSNFGIEVPLSFQTMAPNEFANDRLAQLFLDWQLPSIRTGIRIIRPAFAFTGGVAFGALSNANRQEGQILQDLSEGYYEAGVAARDLLVLSSLGVGLGAYYRIGPYASVREMENFTFRITLSPKF